MVLAGLLAAGIGLGAKSLLGFSGSAGLLTGMFESGSLLLDPVAAVGTAGAFGVGYLAISASLGVGIPLRTRRPSSE
jgi:hypothetical protein